MQSPSRAEAFISDICEQFPKYNLLDTSTFDNSSIKRGLRNSDGTGVMAGVTAVGTVRGYNIIDGDRHAVDGRLIYRGIDVEDLIAGYQAENRFGFEETAFLLQFGSLPDAAQLRAFNDALAELRVLPRGFTEDMILKAPSPDVMNKLARGVLALYSYDERPDDTSLHNLLAQSVALIARLPVIVAHAYAVKRHYYDRESLYFHYPQDDLTMAENFLHALRPDHQYTDEEAKLLDTCLVLHAEHGGGNNSAFSCRVLSSSGTDTYSAIAAAIGSLKGPKHGGANAKVLDMFDCIKAEVSHWDDDDEVAACLCKILRKEGGDGSGLIYGMGHAVYTKSDPRAIILRQQAQQLASQRGMADELALLEAVERLSPVCFAREKGDSKMICANVDLYSGLVYGMLGIPRELLTPIFAISRVAGWCAHRIEEVMTGGRIIRPAYKAIAPDRCYVPLSERSNTI